MGPLKDAYFVSWLSNACRTCTSRAVVIRAARVCQQHSWIRLRARNLAADGSDDFVGLPVWDWFKPVHSNCKLEGYAQKAGVLPNSRASIVHNSYWLAAVETGYLGLVAFVLLCSAH